MNAAAKSKVAVALLVGLIVLAWFTLDSGKVRLVAVLILGMFLFRVVLHTARSRYDEGEREEDEDV